jgi:hypothetical protein
MSTLKAIHLNYLTTLSKRTKSLSKYLSKIGEPKKKFANLAVFDGIIKGFNLNIKRKLRKR